jgi:hypothetical protein
MSGGIPIGRGLPHLGAGMPFSAAAFAWRGAARAPRRGG